MGRDMPWREYSPKVDDGYEPKLRISFEGRQDDWLNARIALDGLLWELENLVAGTGDGSAKRLLRRIDELRGMHEVAFYFDLTFGVKGSELANSNPKPVPEGLV